MENFYLTDVAAEVAEATHNRILRRVWQWGNLLLFDFGFSRTFTDILVASLDPATPLFFVYRPSNAKKPEPLAADEVITPFSLLLKSRVAGARLVGVKKPPFDRMVTLEFTDGPDITNPDPAIQLAFTGRSSNARLIGADGDEAALRKARNPGDHSHALTNTTRTFDAELAMSKTVEDSSLDSILADWFGAASPLGPVMKAEFLARAESAAPAAAFKTLVEDIFTTPHSALVYSRIPLREIGDQQIKPGRDLILAPFELASASAAGLTIIKYSSFCEAATEYWLALVRSQDFQRQCQAFTSQIATRLKSLRSTLLKIETDLARFEDPQKFKRYGDLILANLGSSIIEDGKIRVKDYFEAGEPEIEIDAADAKTLQEAASHNYDLYRKGRRTKEMLIPRRESLRLEIQSLQSILDALGASPSRSTFEEIVSRANKTAGVRFSTSRVPPAKKGEKARKVLGRRFISSDGYEIIVGRNDIENDQITFRVAGSQDVWLHAADYPGSHVVIRNPARKPIPHRTIIEAAEVTAFHSQAKREGKAAVNYTQKKFVSKPPKSKPGLVRISSFKTVLVEPRCDLKRGTE